jgi:uncharacterized protein YjbI with pentapeptide repeats
MTVAELRARWFTTEGAFIRDAAIEWLVGGVRPAGLSEHEGRVDLRGLVLDDVRFLGSVANDVSKFEIIGGTVTVRDAKWVDLDLSYSRLPHMRFYSSSIIGCVFYAADCEDWRLWDCRVRDSSFEKANFRGAAIGTWHDGRPNFWSGISFDGADLRDTNPTGASFDMCSFRGARLKGVHFLQSRIVSCVFAGRLESVLFDERSIPSRPPTYPLRDVDFSAAVFDQVEFRGCSFENVTLPVTPGIRVIERFPVVARRVLDLTSATPSEDAKVLAAVLENSLRGRVEDDSVEVFNRADYISWGGESLADLAEALYLEAETAD